VHRLGKGFVTDRQTAHMSTKNDQERKGYKQKLESLAFFDLLTGIPNRWHFQDDVRKAVSICKRNGTRFAVLYMDCDRFKFVNDTLGNEAGDEVLQGFVKRVRSCLREQDRLYRMGGDEFVAIMTNIESTDVSKAAERILSTFREPWYIRNRVFHMTTSIGISLFPLDADNETALLRNADIALYHAKTSGKNMYRFYNHCMGELLKEQLHLEMELQKALQNEQFLLYYQPQMDIQSRKIIGAEALLRWNHPSLGILGPDKFIALAERNGMMVDITKWVIEEACRQSMEWKRIGLPSKVAVNISAQHLQRNDLVFMIDQVVRKCGMQPGDLEAEITEGAIARDLETAVETISQLKAHGVKVAIDDFGTGFSSLFYLKKLPVDTLKIDRSFISDITANDRDKNIVEFIMKLAEMLGLTVVAEGVESEEQAIILRQQRCHVIQGYLVSKPMPNDLYVKFIYNIQNNGT